MNSSCAVSCKSICVNATRHSTLRTHECVDRKIGIVVLRREMFSWSRAYFLIEIQSDFEKIDD